jgi:hypothetical protein
VTTSDDGTPAVPSELADPPIREQVEPGGEHVDPPAEWPDSVPADNAPGGAVPSELADPPTD